MHVSCDFISLYLFVLTFVIKLKKKTNYKSHRNISVFCDQKKKDVRFEYVPLKNV